MAAPTAAASGNLRAGVGAGAYRSYQGLPLAAAANWQSLLHIFIKEQGPVPRDAVVRAPSPASIPAILKGPALGSARQAKTFL